MDKQQYKEMLSNAISENDFNKKIIDKVEMLVRDNPNNMQLGEKIRDIFRRDSRDISDAQLNIFDE